MRPAFPGMDPWLESPAHWLDVHNSLITSIRDVLAPQLQPRYFVGLESRTTVLTGRDLDLFYRPDVSIQATANQAPAQRADVAVVERPQVKQFPVVVPTDEEIEETYLAIQDVPGRKLVTVIEILSPTNKKTADARAEYLKKRRVLIRSKVNFVEIDLLRGGEPMSLESSPTGFDYRILVCRAPRGHHGVLYPFLYTSPIPPIPIPLLPGDQELELDLNSVLHALIDRARYDLVIDYSQPPDPPLRPRAAAWVASIVAQATATGREPNPIEGAAP